jgi:hypothetical protein
VRKRTENHAETLELLLDSKFEKNKKVEEQEKNTAVTTIKKLVFITRGVMINS